MPPYRSAATRMPAPGAPASAPTSIRNTASISSTTATWAITPRRRQARVTCNRTACSHHYRIAAGYRSHSRPPSKEDFDHVDENIRCARDRVDLRKRTRGGVGRRGEATRHNAYRGRRRKGREQGWHHPGLYGWDHDGARGLQGGRRHPARSLRRREARVL